jgi:hypothetical protein
MGNQIIKTRIGEGLPGFISTQRQKIFLSVSQTEHFSSPLLICEDKMNVRKEL